MFQAFFKAFVVVITLGIFHGIVLLPVLLSYVPPSWLPVLPSEDRKDWEGTVDSDNNVVAV